ncbi:MAG: 30S ribosome-binding factor RbfA [Clostridia bacterium]|nr:30S ribosome-binding factor RbfA [Clostridia bacterium]
MRRNRAAIVGDEMQKVISRIIANDVKDPRIPFMTTVTGVKMSSDLTHATCSISVMGSAKEQKDCLDAILHATKFIRREMCKHINLRVAPELHFELDTTLERASHMDEVINRVRAKDKAIHEKYHSDEAVEADEAEEDSLEKEEE